MNYPVYSPAPAPTALRARLRRRLSTPLLTLALMVLLVAISCLSIPLGLLGVLLAYFGVCWSGEPVRTCIHGRPMEWFQVFWVPATLVFMIVVVLALLEMK